MTATRVDYAHEGAIATIHVDAGRGNVLARAVIAELAAAFGAISERDAVRAVVLVAAGKDFSFGASVPEHLPGSVEHMIPEFGELFRVIARSARPVCVGVRGRCLGGGFELALACHHIVVADDATLGVPEVTLGVFPPLAAAVLPLRVNQGITDRLITLGETITGTFAHQVGLGDECVSAADVDARAMAHAEKYAKLSGAAVRFATRASRMAWNDALESRLQRLEKLYLEELMKTSDALEGLEAFQARRKPEWRHR